MAKEVDIKSGRVAHSSPIEPRTLPCRDWRPGSATPRDRLECNASHAWKRGRRGTASPISSTHSQYRVTSESKCNERMTRLILVSLGS